MKLSFDAKLKLYACVLIAINLVILGSQLDLTGLGQSPGLDFSKEFANSLVSDLQQLAIDLGVAERSVIRHALAQLHYDVFLVGSSSDLARIVQGDAVAVRRTIINEYIYQVGDRVLAVLNESPEVQHITANTILTLEPLPEGGLEVNPEGVLSADLEQQLSELETLFNFAYFRNYYETYRAQSVIQVEIEEGAASLITPAREQVTLEYWEEQIQALRTEYSRVAQSAGFSEIAGAGIRLEIYGFVSAREVRMLVHELFNGAYAVAVDGQRIAVSSYILDDDGGIFVDGVRVGTNPLVIEALGNPRTLSGIKLILNTTLKGIVSHYDIEELDRITLSGKALE